MTGPGGWNDTARPFPQVTLHALIEAQAKRTPDSIAAVFDEVRWTYAELIARSAVLADSLQKAGARPGTVVAVVLHRSLDLLAGIISILMTGAAYLPLDPNTPQTQIDLCLADAAPVTILTQSSLSWLIPAAFPRVLLVDGEELLLNTPTQPPAEQATSDDLAYVIQTSGTTSKPKAVEILHSSLVNLLLSMQQQPGFGPSDTLLAVTTISFDIAMLELFLPLVTGGTVVVASREVGQDPFLLAAAIEKSGCTVMQATPSTWRSLLTTGWGITQPLKYPLRVLCGGEPLPRELAERLLETGAELWNLYGPTETTIWSTLQRVEHGSGPVAIGNPIANTSAYILDEEMRLLPVGATGELYLGGAGLARAYRGMPALTSERFITSEAAQGARLYRTGDIAVRRNDGAIECLGRIDNQVKVRGFRLELEAVEAAVLNHPQVEAAAARVWPDGLGGTSLSVYMVGRNGPPPDLGALRRFLQKNQPDFMIPSSVVQLAALPLTPNGKLDRASLPLTPQSNLLFTAPKHSTEVEKRLIIIWSEVLGVTPIGVQDNFFDLGGHSLLVAILQQRIAVAFGRRLSMASLFHAPTVQQQAALLQAVKDAGPQTPGLIAFKPQGKRSALFWLHPHPLAGNMAASLDDDQPLFGLVLTQSEMDSIAAAPSIEKIAAFHVRKILEVQPRGPYYLAGYCTGGVVAFETATQMKTAGHDVALLGLLDSQNPTCYRRVDSLDVEWSKLIFFLRHTFNQREMIGWFKFAQRFLLRIKKLWQPQQAVTEMSAGEQMAELAAFRYKPSVYKGDILLMRPAEGPSRVDYLPGWKPVVSGEIEVREVAGHHDELFTPSNAASISQVISLYLPT